MLSYIGRRLVVMIPTLIVISMVAFAIIQLPPGDYLTTLVARLSAQGDQVSQAHLDALSSKYGLNEPVWVQYVKWIGGVLRGDFGMSFSWGKPVSTLLAQRLPMTVALGVLSLAFTWAVGFPAGVYAAVRQRSIGDYAVTVAGLVGVAVPGFLVALVVMWLQLRWFGLSPGGVFSPEYVDAPWSVAKVVDLVRHMAAPVVVLGAAGTAATIRYTRSNLLDEL
ncbi:MAG TPA: ABC transporter permease, partial [Acidimicrobiales bacterium]